MTTDAASGPSLTAGRPDVVKAVVTKITKTQAIRNRRTTHPTETQQQTADAVGCSQRFVREVVNDRNRKCESDNVVPVPGWITRRDLQAAFRKLPADERERLEALPARHTP